MRNNKYISFYVYKRPHLDRFLDWASERFDIAVFTAGEKHYADAVLNVIDPRGRVRRRLYKDDCDIVDNAVVKRISKVCSIPRSTMIIDNNPEHCRLDPGM